MGEPVQLETRVSPTGFSEDSGEPGRSRSMGQAWLRGTHTDIGLGLGDDGLSFYSLWRILV